MLVLVAQVADPVSGGAGWLGAGLLGSVLAWLMLKHLPDKDRQLERLVESFRTETAAERKQCAEQFQTQNMALVSLTSALNDERAVMVAQINEHTTKSMADYRHDQKDMINEAVLGRELHMAKKAAEAKWREEQAKQRTEGAS